jgi:hypothetical protein
VGHSCGGRYSLFTAHKLAERGIPVKLVICIDVAFPSEVGTNVYEAVHIYRSSGRVYPARPLQAVPGSAARITNVDLDAHDSPIAPSGLHHLNITANAQVQEWVFQRIRSAVETKRLKNK